MRSGIFMLAIAATVDMTVLVYSFSLRTTPGKWLKYKSAPITQECRATREDLTLTLPNKPHMGRTTNVQKSLVGCNTGYSDDFLDEIFLQSFLLHVLFSVMPIC